jgi:hypothetical protein
MEPATTMMRRTISLPEGVDALIRDSSQPGESYSATVARLVEAGARTSRTRRVPGFVGIAEGDADDLGRNTEKYLRELLMEASPRT